jgi:hypothetical protein
MTTPTAYKCYIFNGTDTYTDISSKVINDVSIPILAINPDQTPILQGIQLETAENYTATGGDSTLDDGVFICLEIGTVKSWYGYIESSRYDYSSKTYFYEVFNIFENLKNKTCYTDLAANVHTNTFNGRSSAFDAVSAIYSGTSVISWNDLTLKELIEHIMEDSDYSGITHTVTWSYGSGFLKTVIENFCVSSLCLKNLGTDYSDEELTSVTVDPDIKLWDLLKELFRILGLRYYYTDALAITIAGTDTAPSTTDYMANDATWLLGKWVNRYDKDIKKVTEKKAFTIKQNMLNIVDYETSELTEDLHRYFSPVMFGIPYIRVANFTQSGENLRLNLSNDHKIPEVMTMFQEFYIKDQFNEILITGEDLNYNTPTSFIFANRTMQSVRYLQANLTSPIDITKIVITLDNENLWATSVITAPSHGLSSSYNASVTDFINNNARYFAAGLYTWETGTAVPSAVGYYTIQDADTITVRRSLISPVSVTTFVFENDGKVTGESGTSGSPYYVRVATADVEKTFDTTVTQDVTVITCGANHNINTATPDIVFINGVSDTIDGTYLYKNRVGGSGLGNPLADDEYWTGADTSATEIYIKHQTDHITVLPARIKPIFPKYAPTTKLTDGKEEQAVNWTDYLVIYRPNYSTASDWKDDWFTVDIEDATYTILQKLASFVPWWFYHYNTAYQTVNSEKLNIDDIKTPVKTTARKIVYNVKDHSIDLEQDSV